MLVIVARSGTESVRTPGPAYSTMKPTLPFVVSRRSISRMMSLAETHGASFPARSTRQMLGAASVNVPCAMAAATSSPPAPMARQPMPPAVGVCESEPSSVFPGPREPLQMHLVADAVPRARVENAVLRRHRLKVFLVVRVLVAVLERVVVHVADGELRLQPLGAHRLELQIRHRPGRVLRESLVNPDRQLAGRAPGFRRPCVH